MEVKTKYNIGDFVYIIHKDLPMRVEITGVRIQHAKHYSYGETIDYTEYNVKIAGLELSAYGVWVSEDAVRATLDEFHKRIDTLIKCVEIRDITASGFRKITEELSKKR